MSKRFSQRIRALNTWVLRLLHAPGLAIFFPTAMLGSYLIWSETGLFIATLLSTMLLAHTWQRTTSPPQPLAPFERPVGRDGAIKILDSALTQSGRTTACLVFGLDDADDLIDRLGHRGMRVIRDRFLERARTAIRDCDQILALDDSAFAANLTPVARMDLETLLSLSARLQTAMSDPVILDAATVYATTSIGFAASDRIENPTGEVLLDAAESAMIEARRNGPGSIRAYSREMHNTRVARHAFVEDVRDALELGQIVPWFQPQLSTDTGEVSGFEALARWEHPERGTISPGEFLPALDRSGLMERLGEVVLYHSLTALKAWDRAGEKVPTVGVNFCASELRNPTLLDKITWELDRFGLSPDRLTVEVLESVIADSNDDITQRNIAGLAELGCAIDLDDFGTGHASITSLRRFSVSRLKIDRSFVMKVDRDRDQQRLVSAILTMADQLGLDSLAEGVETSGEHGMLAQLGCRHVQGYGLGRPMPFADTLDWLRKHRSKLGQTPEIGRSSSA